ncbi:hemolymph juvenile hormone-binding protein [Oryctes borbonicus]|uniref:Hemolymph juvenile hormone-binding protein n=1 Tax=Oryctes borbonicus TaxID=1629725 RepID=A0A0T6B5R1_9SCAR|nr:hemolymph juvenile hormone-binding protein [Oryctes borbonicus]
MLRVDVPNTVTELLKAVTPHFQERLQENFQEQGLRRQRVHPNHKTSLKNVIVLDKGANIELSNLKIIEMGQCTLKNFHLKLEMFNIFLEANINHLMIEGDYKQSCLNTLVPMSHSGKIEFNLEDLAIDGNIGICNVEDSFVTKNYDVNMKLGKICTKVVCKNGSQDDVFECTDTDIRPKTHSNENYKALLKQFKQNQWKFCRLLTADENWIHEYTPEAKKREALIEAKTVPSTGKVMATVFWG